MVTAQRIPAVPIGRNPEEIYAAIAAADRPCLVVRDADGLGVTSDETTARNGARVLAAVAPLTAERLGDPGFLRDHGVRVPYMAGAMANGIASAFMVAELARAGFLASFGAAGLSPERVEEALVAIAGQAPGLPFACNLIHSPAEPRLERTTVDLCLRHRVRCVEASAFMDLTPEVVRYRLAGLVRDPSGRVRAGNRLIAKVSRAEVAERFLRPAPPAMVTALVEAGAVTAEQAELARSVPMADDLTAESDSGGHTDRRPLGVLLPDLIALRDRTARELGLAWQVRVGAAGGLGTPAAVYAAFALGAAYVVTGSVNQACVEAAQSETAKRLLAAADVADCDMAPSADMFELGAEVQVLRRGTMFAAKARRLAEVYRAYDGIDAIPAAERAGLEERVFRRPIEEVWRETVRYFDGRDPEQIHRAEGDPRRRMALVFRWYLGLSSGWSIAGDPGRLADYQIWCGPAMGAFNNWAAGTYLAPVENRRVADVAGHLMRGAAFTGRVAQLRLAGVRLPASCTSYVPLKDGWS